MKKDIFIDNNVTKKFVNPMDPEYKRLIEWLNYYDKNNHQNCAHLVISNKLLVEYYATVGNSTSPNNIVFIIARMTIDGRLNKVTNDDIKEFQSYHFKKRVVNSLMCNKKDWDHIATVLLSDRKMALTLDHNFLDDLISFPGFKVIAGRRPQDIPYDS